TDSLDGVCRLLPDPIALQRAIDWSGERPEHALQKRPDPPIPSVLPADLPAPDGVARPLVRQSGLVTKLRLLARCHDVEAWAQTKQRLLKGVVLLLTLLVGSILGALAGFGVYLSIYNPVERYARRYEHYNPATNHIEREYYITGVLVSQQQYDTYRAQHDSRE